MKERERNINVREKHQLVAFCRHPNQGPNPQPRHEPWVRIKPTTFQFMGQHSNQLSRIGQGLRFTFINWKVNRPNVWG